MDKRWYQLDATPQQLAQAVVNFVTYGITMSLLLFGLRHPAAILGFLFALLLGVVWAAPFLVAVYVAAKIFKWVFGS